MSQTLGICMPGATTPTIDLMATPWHLETMKHGVAERKLALVGESGSDGELPARLSRRGNTTHEYRLRVTGADRDAVQNTIGAIEQALIEAERILAEGDWVDPGLDTVRVVWKPDGSTLSLWRPIVGGIVEQITDNDGQDRGYTILNPVVNVTLDVGPAWYGDRAQLVAQANTDANRIADNTAVAIDVPAPGGDLPPWVDLLIIEDDAQARHHVLVTAESPKTGDTDYIAATALTTTGYGGSVASGTMSMTSTDWRFMCEIPAQSHDRARRLTLVHAAGGGQVRVRWKAGGVERESNVIQLPASGYADVEVCLVQGDWIGVIEGRGTVTHRGLRLVGADGRGEAWSAPSAGLGSQGELTHSDDFSVAGTLNGKALDLGGNWATLGATTDFSNSGGTAQRTTTADSSARIGLAGAATPAWVLGAVDLKCSSGAATPDWPVGFGLILRYVDSSNFFFVGVSSPVGSIVPTVRAGVVVAGVITWLTGPWLFFPLMFGRVEAAISEDGAFQVRTHQSVWRGYQGSHPQLAAGGVLASGRVGIYDRWSGSANTRQWSNFQVRDTPWRSDPLLPQGGDLRLAGGAMLHDSGGNVSHRGNGLVELHPQETSRLYIAAKRGRDAVASVANNETDNLEVSVHARPRYLSVPTPAPTP